MSTQLKLASSLTIHLPKWLVDDIANGLVPERLTTTEEQMRFAINLSFRNAEKNTGGPFGAVIVESATGIIVGLGVNRVVPESCSLMHGETTAIAMAQAALGTFNLGGASMPAHTLITSAQPCCMCCGATVWSGVTKLITGASGADVETLTGFDESPIHPD